jgi:2-iminobutanoate/2-iminopropanoate deaminase
MVRFFLVMTCAGLLAACATTPGTERATCTHDDEQVEREIGYCQVIKSGHTLHVSGVVGGGSMETALPQVYQQLGQILARHGASLHDVVKETIFTTDMNALIKAQPVRLRYYDGWLPAASWVQVEQLYLPEFVIEVELTVELPP